MTLRPEQSSGDGGRYESGEDACKRLSLPYREADDPILYAMARVFTEHIGYQWDALPFHDLDASVSQTYYLLLAKSELEALRERGCDVVRTDSTVYPSLAAKVTDEDVLTAVEAQLNYRRWRVGIAPLGAADQEELRDPNRLEGPRYREIRAILEAVEAARQRRETDAPEATP